MHPSSEPVSLKHATILVGKGAGTMIRPVRFPFKVFFIGNMADLLSAAILFTCTPPVLNDYKHILAEILFLKGMRGLIGMSQNNS